MKTLVFILLMTCSFISATVTAEIKTNAPHSFKGKSGSYRVIAKDNKTPSLKSQFSRVFKEVCEYDAELKMNFKKNMKKQVRMLRKTIQDKMKDIVIAALKEKNI